MKSRKAGPNHILVLAKGEEVVQTISDYCARERIAAAWVQGVGAVKHVQIGYYDEHAKEYLFKIQTGPYEVAAMQGNIVSVDGKPFAHLHAVLSKIDDSLSCIGAHVKAMVVSVTLEVLLTPLDVPISRRYDEDIGLNLLDV
jgi:predicted DNA-binding protein with PD1-like motif